ncbi:MAG TPA: antitoxin [Candidatus Dormibacteraeota bacterium]
MATIQVREIPEESYETLRRRARRHGMSMQAYVRRELIALAGRPNKEEALEAIDAAIERLGLSQPSIGSILEDLAADRR